MPSLKIIRHEADRHEITHTYVNHGEGGDVSTYAETIVKVQVFAAIEGSEPEPLGLHGKTGVITSVTGEYESRNGGQWRESGNVYSYATVQSVSAKGRLVQRDLGMCDYPVWLTELVGTVMVSWINEQFPRSK